MKVLHVIWHLGQGGAQTYLYDLLRQIRASGGVTTEVLVLSQRGALSEKIEKLGVPVKHLGMRSSIDVFGIIRLYAYLRESDQDIIHSHTPDLSLSYIFGRIPGPKIYTEHGGTLLGSKWRDRLIYKLFQHNYDRFMAISNVMANVMEATNPKVAGKIRVVYDGVDLKEIDAATPHEGDGLPLGFLRAQFRVGIIARLVPQKGLTVFLETAAVIARAREDVIFAVIGDGPLRSDLESQAKHFGIGDKIFFLGFRLDAKRILKLFDVFLFTSNYEPFGLVLTEAMAAGVPVVALHVKSAVNEIVEDGVDGFVVDRKDPSLLAERVLTILDNPILRESFVKNARRKVEQLFTMDQNVQQVLKIYRECLQER